MKIKINDILLKEALDYAKLSRSYTSDTHDFHEGGINAKQRKMFEGKIGEKAIKQYFLNNKIRFTEDKSSFKDADKYDFIIYGKNRKFLVDVKTRTQKFHTRTLEMVKQIQSKNIDIYISVKLEKIYSKYEVLIIGWCSKKDFIKKNRIENNGYLDNYVLYDNELREINNLFNYL
tara:strand:- start:392 stop:916 length:525 start_codon:yes stop_codon:yes gene_type:complete